MTQPTFFVEEDKILSSLFDEGLDDLHLYKPGSSPMYSERLLTLLPDEYRKRITVHDNFYLKEEYKLHGIHINDETTPAPKGYKGHISRTCTHLEQLKETKKNADYVLLKYIFDSQTEPDQKATFTLEELKEASRKGLIDRHVYALGGMNLDTIKAVKDLGFGGIVISGDLWNRFNIHQDDSVNLQIIISKMSSNKNYMVFSGTATKYLAEKICQSLGCPLGKLQITKFSDGEFAVSYEESIRGRDIFLVQSTFPNSDNLMELLLMIDAAKRASARTINAVIPYFGWARQDRKDKPRVSIGAKLVADLLSAAGVNRVITMDLHADQIQGFFDVPVDHLYASGVILPYLQSLHLEDLVIASPDVGGSKRANTYAKYLGCPLVLCNKTRARANVVATMQIIGEVEGKNVVIIDDMVDTAGTITKAADIMKEAGAKTVRACASHCVMSGPASERVQNSALEEIVFTDSIPYSQRCAKVKQLSVADMFAETIRRVINNESISDQYIV